MSNYSGKSWLDKDVNLSGRSYRNFMKHNRNKTDIPVEFITLTPKGNQSKNLLQVPKPQSPSIKMRTQSPGKKPTFLSSNNSEIKQTIFYSFQKNSDFQPENQILPTKLLDRSDSASDISFQYTLPKKRYVEDTRSQKLRMPPPKLFRNENDWLEVELLMEELQRVALSKIVHEKRLTENKPWRNVSPPAISENNDSSFVMTPYYSIQSEPNENDKLFANYNSYIIKLVKEYIEKSDFDVEKQEKPQFLYQIPSVYEIIEEYKVSKPQQIPQQNNNLKKMRKMITDKDVEIEKLKDSFMLANKKIKLLMQTLDDLKIQNQNLTETNEGQKITIQTSEKTIRQYEILIEKQRKKLQEIEREKLIQKEKFELVISDFNFNVEAFKAQIEGLRTQLNEKMKEIQEAASTIFDKNEEISSLKRKNTELDQKHISLNFQFNTKVEIISALNQDIQDLIKSHQTELQSLNKKHAQKIFENAQTIEKMEKMFSEKEFGYNRKIGEKDVKISELELMLQKMEKMKIQFEREIKDKQRQWLQKIEIETKKFKEEHAQEVSSIKYRHQLEIEELLRKYVRPVQEDYSQTQVVDLSHRPIFNYNEPKKQEFTEEYRNSDIEFKNKKVILKNSDMFNKKQHQNQLNQIEDLQDKNSELELQILELLKQINKPKQDLCIQTEFNSNHVNIQTEIESNEATSQTNIKIELSQSSQTEILKTIQAQSQTEIRRIQQAQCQTEILSQQAECQTFQLTNEKEAQTIIQQTNAEIQTEVKTIDSVAQTDKLGQAHAFIQTELFTTHSPCQTDPQPTSNFQSQTLIPTSNLSCQTWIPTSSCLCQTLSLDHSHLTFTAPTTHEFSLDFKPSHLPFRGQKCAILAKTKPKSNMAVQTMVIDRIRIQYQGPIQREAEEEFKPFKKTFKWKCVVLKKRTPKKKVAETQTKEKEKTSQGDQTMQIEQMVKPLFYYQAPVTKEIQIEFHQEKPQKSKVILLKTKQRESRIKYEEIQKPKFFYQKPLIREAEEEFKGYKKLFDGQKPVILRSKPQVVKKDEIQTYTIHRPVFLYKFPKLYELYDEYKLNPNIFAQKKVIILKSKLPVIKKTDSCIQTQGVENLMRPPFVYSPPEIQEQRVDYQNDYKKLGFKRPKISHAVFKKIQYGKDSIPRPPFVYQIPEVHQFCFDYVNDYRKLGFKRPKISHALVKVTQFVERGFQTIGIDSIPRAQYFYKPAVQEEISQDYVNDYRKLEFKRPKISHAVQKIFKIEFQTQLAISELSITPDPVQLLDFTSQTHFFDQPRPIFHYQKSYLHELSDEYKMPPKLKEIVASRAPPIPKKYKECQTDFFEDCPRAQFLYQNPQIYEISEEMKQKPRPKRINLVKAPPKPKEEKKIAEISQINNSTQTICQDLRPKADFSYIQPKIHELDQIFTPKILISPIIVRSMPKQFKYKSKEIQTQNLEVEKIPQFVYKEPKVQENIEKHQDQTIVNKLKALYLKGQQEEPEDIMKQLLKRSEKAESIIINLRQQLKKKVVTGDQLTQTQIAQDDKFIQTQIVSGDKVTQTQIASDVKEIQTQMVSSDEKVTQTQIVQDHKLSQTSLAVSSDQLTQTPLQKLELEQILDHLNRPKSSKLQQTVSLPCENQGCQTPLTVQTHQSTLCKPHISNQFIQVSHLTHEQQCQTNMQKSGQNQYSQTPMATKNSVKTQTQEEKEEKIDVSRIEINKQKCVEIMQEIKKTMVEAKKQSNDDNEFINLLLVFEESSRKIEKEFNSVDHEIQNIQKNKNVNEIIQKLMNIEKQFEQKYEELNEILNNRMKKQELQKKINVTLNKIDINYKKFQELLSKMPQQVDSMLYTLQEMKYDPNDDYMEQMDQIETNFEELQRYEIVCQHLSKFLEQIAVNVDYFIKKVKATKQYESLKELFAEIHNFHLNVKESMNNGYNQLDEIHQIKKEFADFWIPVNIQKRKDDVKELWQIYESLKNEPKILKLQKVIQSHQEILDKLLEYEDRDFRSFSNQKIIIQVRDLKSDILETQEKIENVMNSGNALEQIPALQKKLTDAKTEIIKIRKIGEEMDGNTTQNEEELFITEMQDQIPNVIKNIDTTLAQISYLQKTDVRNGNQQFQEISEKVEQTVTLVQKLENVIIDWNAIKKIQTRYEELSDINTLLKEFHSELREELAIIDTEQLKNQMSMENSPTVAQEQHMLKHIIMNCITDTQNLMNEVIQLQSTRSHLFALFDSEVPQRVKQENRGDIMSIESNYSKPVDIYQLLSVNCKYKPRIKSLLSQLNTINEKRRQLDEKYGQLKKELKNVSYGEYKAYKPVKGDKIDELFAIHMNKLKPQNQPHIYRVSVGKYILGSQTILAKIINEKLVIRVGGGYMNADEFIAQKSHKGVSIESLKNLIQNFGQSSEFKFLKLEKCQQAEEEKEKNSFYSKRNSKNSAQAPHVDLLSEISEKQVSQSFFDSVDKNLILSAKTPETRNKLPQTTTSTSKRFSLPSLDPKLRIRKSSTGQ